MNFKKSAYTLLGCICVALGAFGAAVPILPTFPFLMLAALCFAKSSEKLHIWFTETALYKKNLESFVNEKGMTRKTKLRIMVTVTLTLLLGFSLMGEAPIGRVVLLAVFIFHVLYLSFGIRTITEK